MFFGLTFGLGWGFAALMMIFIDHIEAIFGEISMTNPAFILVVYSPAIAGLLIVWRHGRDGLRSYLRRLTLWRLPRAWWVFLVSGSPPSSTWAQSSAARSAIRSIFRPGTACSRPWRSRS